MKLSHRHDANVVRTEYFTDQLNDVRSLDEMLLEVIKSKFLPILLYGTDVCPTNSADRHTLQFTINKIMYKIFGAMSDLYSEICVHFGIDFVENLVANRRNRFIKRYGEMDTYLCQNLR